MTAASLDTLELRNRVCVVTGAGGGIGRATATALARAGARVVLLDRNAGTAEAARDSIRAEGAEAICIPCDAADPASVEAAAHGTADTFGGADILVNNAGLLQPGPLESLSFADWNYLLSVNLTGYFLCAQTFARQMRQRGGGTIVHVASIAGHYATGFSGAYSVAKAGIIMLSRQIAVEWGTHGIRSNVVSPGMILTPLSHAFYEQPGVTERRSAVVPAGRIGQPEDVAAAVLFLAGPRANYITGDEITVDGGFTRNIMSLIPRPGYEHPSAEE
jgi:NAD(P)-dependent dehydrogenase (short-subunit alcohol dehydrogenase family)